MRRIGIARMFMATVIGVGMVAASASMASASAGDVHKVTICHATASKTNPYVVITVDVASIGDVSGHGRSGVNAGDIIPPFPGYPGNNWDAAHAATAASECGLTIPISTPDGQVFG